MSHLIWVCTVCHSVIGFLTETPICNNGCDQIQGPFHKLRGERMKSNMIDNFACIFNCTVVSPVSGRLKASFSVCFRWLAVDYQVRPIISFLWFSFAVASNCY